MMAGMIVMPACYAFLGGETSSGPGLLFLSMQIVFEKMGYVGNIMGFLFYSLEDYACQPRQRCGRAYGVLPPLL